MRCSSSKILILTLAVMAASVPVRGQDRPRARDVGLAPGILRPGALNAITDVEGVRVGHASLRRGDSVRTGVTAIVPAPGNLFRSKLRAAVHVGNGFGKPAGFVQVAELGTLETPIVLTNTLSVAAAIDALVQWTLRQSGNEDVVSVNAVVGETNDGWLNDIRGGHVGREDVIAAIESARAGPVEEGSVGAGTGTRAFGWKGGIGTSSRVLPERLGGYTVGALVQSNFGGVLIIDGLPVGERLGRHDFRDDLAGDGGSVMIVLATDAPVSERNLERLARRGILGLARTGSYMSNGSGDFVIAFSTRNRVADPPPSPVVATDALANEAMSPLFLAAVESVEEAVYNSLLRATTVSGRAGRTVEALPIERLREMIEQRRRGAAEPADPR